MMKKIRNSVIIILCVSLLFLGYRQYSLKKEKERYIDFTKSTIVMQLEALSRLETASMTMQKTVKGKNGLKDYIPSSSRDNVVQSFLFEDSIEMIATAKIVAGFDLAEIDSGSVIVNEDKSVTLKLPKAEILQYSLTPETKPFIRTRGILNPGDIALETEIRNKTLEQMKQEAIDAGILQKAEENAINAMKNIVGVFGIQLKTVVIE